MKGGAGRGSASRVQDAARCFTSADSGSMRGKNTVPPQKTDGPPAGRLRTATVGPRQASSAGKYSRSRDVTSC